jgi:hypothetical protein
VGRADVHVAQIRGHKIWTAEQCMTEAPAHSFAVQYRYWGHGLNIGTCQQVLLVVQCACGCAFVCAWHFCRDSSQRICVCCGGSC